MNAKNSILVVEGSRTQAERLRLALEKYNYAVTVVTRGREALEAARGQRPALILSGVAVSGMNGYDMCAALKQDPAVKNIPVVLLTAVNEMEDLLRGLRAKVDYYIAKPYEEEELAARISAIMSGLAQEVDQPGSEQLEILLRGEREILAPERLQLLRLLLSMYENYSAALRQTHSLSTEQLQLKTQNQHLQEEYNRLQAAFTEIPLSEVKERETTDVQRVLIAEDTAIGRTLLTHFLEKLECHVEVVTSGNEAVEAYQKRNYAAILIDVQTPMMGGLEAVAYIREYERTSGGHIPIIALSVQEDSEEQERYASAGLDGCVAKPISLNALRRALESLIPHFSVSSQPASPLAAEDDRR